MKLDTFRALLLIVLVVAYVALIVMRLRHQAERRRWRAEDRAVRDARSVSPQANLKITETQRKALQDWDREVEERFGAKENQ